MAANFVLLQTKKERLKTIAILLQQYLHYRNDHVIAIFKNSPIVTPVIKQFSDLDKEVNLLTIFQGIIYWRLICSMKNWPQFLVHNLGQGRDPINLVPGLELGRQIYCSCMNMAWYKKAKVYSCTLESQFHIKDIRLTLCCKLCQKFEDWEDCHTAPHLLFDTNSCYEKS